MDPVLLGRTVRFHPCLQEKEGHHKAARRAPSRPQNADNRPNSTLKTALTSPRGTRCRACWCPPCRSAPPRGSPSPPPASSTLAAGRAGRQHSSPTSTDTSARGGASQDSPESTERTARLERPLQAGPRTEGRDPNRQTHTHSWQPHAPQLKRGSKPCPHRWTDRPEEVVHTKACSSAFKGRTDRHVPDDPP